MQKTKNVKNSYEESHTLGYYDGFSGTDWGSLTTNKLAYEEGFAEGEAARISAQKRRAKNEGNC